MFSARASPGPSLPKYASARCAGPGRGGDRRREGGDDQQTRRQTLRLPSLRLQEEELETPRQIPMKRCANPRPRGQSRPAVPVLQQPAQQAAHCGRCRPTNNTAACSPSCKPDRSRAGGYAAAAGAGRDAWVGRRPLQLLPLPLRRRAAAAGSAARRRGDGRTLAVACARALGRGCRLRSGT